MRAFQPIIKEDRLTCMTHLHFNYICCCFCCSDYYYYYYYFFYYYYYYTYYYFIVVVVVHYNHGPCYNGLSAVYCTSWTEKKYKLYIQFRQVTTHVDDRKSFVGRRMYSKPFHCILDVGRLTVSLWRMVREHAALRCFARVTYIAYKRGRASRHSLQYICVVLLLTNSAWKAQLKITRWSKSSKHRTGKWRSRFNKVENEWPHKKRQTRLHLPGAPWRGTGPGALLTQVQSVLCTAGPCTDGPLFGKIANYDTWFPSVRTENIESGPLWKFFLLHLQNLKSAPGQDRGTISLKRGSGRH